MYKGFSIKPPFFEIGPKAYLYGRDVLELALAAERASEKYDVQIIFTPQYTDIPLLSNETKRLLVFAQHMDCLLYTSPSFLLFYSSFFSPVLNVFIGLLF